MTDVHHAPWELHRLEALAIEAQTMLASHGVTVAETEPDHTMWSPGVDTVVWAPRRVV